MSAGMDGGGSVHNRLNISFGIPALGECVGRPAALVTRTGGTAPFLSAAGLSCRYVGTCLRTCRLEGFGPETNLIVISVLLPSFLFAGAEPERALLKMLPHFLLYFS